MFIIAVSIYNIFRSNVTFFKDRIMFFSVIVIYIIITIFSKLMIIIKMLFFFSLSELK